MKTKENKKEEELGIVQSPPMTDAEMDMISDFIEHDLTDAQDFQMLYSNKDYSDAEAFILYPDYMVIRHKSTNKSKKHCESLALDVDHETNIDITETIIRESISSFVVHRQQSCDCDKCLADVVSGKSEDQPEGYIIEVGSSGRRHSLFIDDKEYASYLGDHFRDWRLKRGVFKHKLGVYHKIKSSKK